MHAQHQPSGVRTYLTMTGNMLAWRLGTIAHQRSPFPMSEFIESSKKALEKTAAGLDKSVNVGLLYHLYLEHSDCDQRTW